MKRVKTIARPFYGILAGALLLISCISEEDNWKENEKRTGKETNVRVTLLMSAAAPRTYAISKIDENSVQTIDVLAFKRNNEKPSGWEFAYSAEGKSITDVADDNPVKAKKQFNVTLVKSPEEQTFVVLANVRNLITGLGEIGTGADKEELLARLVVENAGSWNANNDNNKGQADPDRFSPFPMWGEIKEILTDAKTQITGISMLRGIARLDVALSESVITANNFKLDKIYIYNSKNKGQVVPAPLNMETAGKVHAATLPAGNINNASPLIYPVPDNMRTAFEQTIYLFEAKGTTADKASEATCMVVGGKFGDENAATTYYRLDFFKKNAQGNYTKDYRDLLRNHKYRINITSVSGKGYDTPDDAFNSKAINMEAEVIEWDDGGIGNVIFDGQHTLSVAPVEFNLSRDALTAIEVKNALAIFTDSPTGWAIPTASITDAVTGNPVTWVKVMSGSPGTPSNAGVADTKANLWLQAEENTGSAPRSAKIIVTAGRMHYAVIVNQSVIPGIGIDIVDPVTNETITEMMFTSAVGVQPDVQSFKVIWSPKNADLLVFGTQIGANAFPSPKGTVTGGNNGTGMIIFDVQPLALTTAEVTPPSGNPFLEKISKLDFTVSNGVSYESKSIFLRQKRQ